VSLDDDDGDDDDGEAWLRVSVEHAARAPNPLLMHSMWTSRVTRRA